MFNPPTRVGVVKSTRGFGYGLAGRGGDLNDAIHAFVPLISDLGPVTRNLASRKTDLGGFFRGLEAFSRAVVPVAQQQAELYGNLDTTFTALSTIAVPYLQDWISQTPPTFQTVIDQAPVLDPVPEGHRGAVQAARPGLRHADMRARRYSAQAEIAGIRNLPGTTSLDQELTTLAQHLQASDRTRSCRRGWTASP